MDKLSPEYFGNKYLLSQPKVAFLAPEHVPLLAERPAYTWAANVIANGLTIVSGYTAVIEKEIWDMVERDGGTMILVLVRASFKNIPSKYLDLIAEGRLLIIFLGLSWRMSRGNVMIRDEYICDLTDSIVFPSMNNESSLYPIYRQLIINNMKEVTVLI
ncbi:MAG: hypothetical protein HDS03_03325 [Bacteroides sp.]|nr:hypothetical protein [Bacteroides sp.]